MLAGCTPRNDQYVEPPQDSIEAPDTQTEETIGANSTGLSNKLLAWGFKKEKNKAPSMPSEYTSVLEAYDGYYLGNQKKKVLYV